MAMFATQSGIGTDLVFDLSEEGDFTIVRFGHKNWREAVEFMEHCSMKWAVFLLSLRSLVETGQGRPAPDDLKIDNWNWQRARAWRWGAGLRASARRHRTT
jgi:hypothetical protein